MLPYVKSIEGGPANLKIAPPDQPIHRTFIGDLIIMYVLDEDKVFHFVAQRDLEPATLSISELHKRAVANLASKVKARGIRVQPHENIFAIFFDGNLEATLTLHEPLWDYLHSTIGDEIMVAVPSRDVLAVGSASNQQSCAELRAVIDRVSADGDHLLTTALLLHRSSGNWTIWRQ